MPKRKNNGDVVEKGASKRHGVDATGAKRGDFLVGHGRCKGLQLEICEGQLFPCEKTLKSTEGAETLSRFWRLSTEETAHRIAQFKPYSSGDVMDEKVEYYIQSAPHCSIGQTCQCQHWNCSTKCTMRKKSTCKVRIVSLGDCISICETSEEQSALINLRDQSFHQPISTYELFKAFGGHTLTISNTEFHISDVCTQSSTPYSGILIDLHSDWDQGKGSATRVENYHRHINNANETLFVVDESVACLVKPSLCIKHTRESIMKCILIAYGYDSKSMVCEEKEDVCGEGEEEVIKDKTLPRNDHECWSNTSRGVHDDIKACFDFLEMINLGPLKSVLQKTIRFGANRVRLPDGRLVKRLPDGRLVCATLFAMCCFGVCFLHRGYLDRVLNTFVLGRTSAFKRLAVIAMEDSCSWKSNVPDLTCWLLGVAFVTQKYPLWVVPELDVIQAMRFTCVLRKSVHAIQWKGRPLPDEISPPLPFQQKSIGIPSLEEYTTIVYLLRSVKSLGGDYIMANAIRHSIEKNATKMCEMPLKTIAEQSTTIMPVAHGVDQHAFRSIVHYLGSDGVPYPKKMGQVFNSVTGFNPRRDTTRSWSDIEALPFTIRLRKAQEQCLAITTGHGGHPNVTHQLEYKAAQHDTLKLAEVSYSHLAAAVGHVFVKAKQNMIVTLPVKRGGKETVLIRPKPREPKKTKHYEISADVEKQAIAKARKMTFNISSYVLPLGTKVHYNNGWCVDGLGWDEYVNNPPRSLSRTIALECKQLNATLEWESSDVMQEVVNQALCPLKWVGIVNGLRVADDTGYLQKLINRYGQNALVRACAWVGGQWQQLVVPTLGINGKRDVTQDTAFDDDPNTYQFLAHLSLFCPGVFGLDPNQLPNFRVLDPLGFKHVEELLFDKLRQHNAQTYSTGWVKTWKKPRFYTDPEEALKKHQKRAVDRMFQDWIDRPHMRGCFLHGDCSFGKTRTILARIDRILATTGKLPKYMIWIVPGKEDLSSMEKEMKKCGVPFYTGWTKRKSELVKPHCINIVTLNFLRIHEEFLLKNFSQIYPHFDEVDTAFPPSERGSVAFELARLCPMFSAATATLIPNGKLRHVRWLQLFMPDAPITKNNWIVATNSLVRENFDLGTTRHYLQYEVPFPHDDKEFVQQYEKLEREKNKAQLFQLVLKHLTPHMIKLTQELSPRFGRILLWADTEAHVETLHDLCKKTGILSGDYENITDEKYPTVILNSRTHCRTINGGECFIASVRVPSASNASLRYQQMGRQDRFGQKSKDIYQYTVTMQGTCVEDRYHAHESIDKVNMACEGLMNNIGAQHQQEPQQQRQEQRKEEQQQQRQKKKQRLV